jgi:hypothetical protein
MEIQARHISTPWRARFKPKLQPEHESAEASSSFWRPIDFLNLKSEMNPTNKLVLWVAALAATLRDLKNEGFSP